MFTSIDYDKFRALRVTHVATRLEELIQDEANDTLTPEQLFLTAVDDALESRRINKVDKLIRQAAFPIPGATVAEVDYRDGRGITPVRMRRYAVHDWRSDATNLLIISPTGGGKTYLACALAIGACQSEHSVLYFRMDDLAVLSHFLVDTYSWVDVLRGRCGGVGSCRSLAMVSMRSFVTRYQRMAVGRPSLPAVCG